MHFFDTLTVTEGIQQWRIKYIWTHVWYIYGTHVLLTPCMQIREVSGQANFFENPAITLSFFAYGKWFRSVISNSLVPLKARVQL